MTLKWEMIDPQVNNLYAIALSQDEYLPECELNEIAKREGLKLNRQDIHEVYDKLSG